MTLCLEDRENYFSIHEREPSVRTTALNVDAVQENLAYVMGRELQRLPVPEADVAFAKLCEGKPQLIETGDTVAILFANGEPFTSCSVHELTVPPPSVTYHGDSVTLG